MKDLGQKIKKLRELKGLKQEYVAEELGMTQPTYSKLEHDGDNIAFSKLDRIATVLDMKPEHIINFDENAMFHLSENNHVHKTSDESIKEIEFHKEESKKKDKLIRALTNRISKLIRKEKRK